MLAVDRGNTEAEDLLTSPGDAGEIRRLTILFADLVDSTVLSRRVEPEIYHLLVGRYRERVLAVVNRYEGHVDSIKGDGLLAVFGHPTAHEDDVRRAVLAGLEITREVSLLGEQAKRRFGVDIAVRVGVHRGPVYLDITEDDVYGLAANLAERMSGLALPGTVVVSEAVAPLVRDRFELEGRPAATVKGVEGPIAYYLVLGERDDAARVGVGRGPLVGRERELAQLQQSWARAQAGMLSLPGVVFRGEPGIGKSRMVAAAVELVEGCGAVVLELLGSPFHADAGLHPVRSLLEHRCGIARLTDAGERLRLLAGEVKARSLDPVRMVPLLAPVLGISGEAGYEPVAAEGCKLYELIEAAVQEYLLACFGAGAGLLVAEDAHWFDASTLDVLGSLLDASQGRLLVVIAGRPGGWLPAHWPVEVFDLTPLSDDQADTLMTALDPAVSAEDRAAVRDRCDGIPLYIEQMVREPGEKPAEDSAEMRVPDALYEPLFARLRATADVVPVLEAAGVIGRHVDRGLLRSVVDLSEDEIDHGVAELEDALVLEAQGPDGWWFRHELLREVAAELAPPSVRRGLHAKVADALLHGVGGGNADWAVVAGHYELAQRFDEAAAAYQQAAAAAQRRGALAESRTYLNLALAGLDRAAPGPDRDRREMPLRFERGFLTAAVEGYQNRGAAGDFERCLQLCETDLTDNELVVTLFALAGYYALQGDLRRAARVLESLGATPPDGRRWLRPVIEVGCGVVAWLRGEFDAATSHLQHAARGLTAADQDEIDSVWIQPDEPVASAHVYLALVALVRGDLPGAKAELAQVARRAEGLGFPQAPYVRAMACYVEIWLRIEAGQLDRAAALAADLIDQGERHGFDAFRLLGSTQQAAVSALATLGTEEPDPAALPAHIATMTTLADTLRTVGLNIYAAFHDGVVARLLTAAGQPERGRVRLDTALRLARDTGVRYYDAELLRLRADTFDHPEARRADIGAALELARRQGATLYELRSALADFELRGEPGRRSVAEALSRFPANSRFPELAQAGSALSSTDPQPR
ncbi:MAG TPA: adenylate/guanylate cyclase domain-containing protein [Mycobacterium sp.]